MFGGYVSFLFCVQCDVPEGKKNRKYRPLSEQRIEQINFFYDAHLCRAQRAARTYEDEGPSTCLKVVIL